MVHSHLRKRRIEHRWESGIPPHPLLRSGALPPPGDVKLDFRLPSSPTQTRNQPVGVHVSAAAWAVGEVEVGAGGVAGGADVSEQIAR